MGAAIDALIKRSQQQTSSSFSAPKLDLTSSISNRTANSTPATTTLNINPITPFLPRKEAVPFRRAFETTPIQTKAPPIVTTLAGLGNMGLEALPRLVATVGGEIAGKGQPVEVKSNVDLRRFGYDTPNYQTAAKEQQDAINKGENPWISGLGIVSNKTLDIAFGAQIVTGLARTATAKLLAGGVEARIAAQDIIETTGRKEMREAFARLKDAPLDVREKTLAELTNAKNQAEKILKEQGSPTALDRARAKIAQTTEVIGRETPISPLKTYPERLSQPDVTPKTAPLSPTYIAGNLPGYRETPGQAPAFGLSTRSVERVGGEAPKPKIEYKVGEKSFTTIEEASKYKNELDNANRQYMFEPSKRVDTTIRGVEVPLSLTTDKLAQTYTKVGRASFDPANFSKADEVMSNIQAEMDTAMAGERRPVNDRLGYQIGYEGTKSTFPSYIPEDLRSRKLFDSINFDFNNIKYPKGSRQARLYDAIMDEMDRRLGVDTTAIRGEVKAPTHAEQVAGTIKETPKTIQQIAMETKIKEPNVRRILGMGAKEGTFTRVDKDGITRKPSLKFSKEGIPLSTAKIEARIAKRQIPQSIKDSPKEIDAYEKSLMDTFESQGQAVKGFRTFEEVPPDPVEFPQQVEEVRKLAKDIGLKTKTPQYTDIGNVKKQGRDIFRNTEQVFGKDFPTIEKSILDPFDASKGKYIDDINTLLDDLNANVVKKYGFKQGSKESAAIQKYGEGNITKEELVKKFGEKKAGEIVDSEKWFRKTYDDLLNKVNEVEQQIYPNSPEKWTPHRKDYFRHFTEMKSDFERLQMMLEHPTRIDPMLVGISEGTKPKSRWASFKQARLGLETKEDAIRGLLDYIPNASYAINIDPHIGKFRELADVLRRTTGKERNLNNYIYNLEYFANDLAGKSNELDRIVNEFIPGGRTTLNVIDFSNKRVKANTILMNLSSSIAQLWNIPNGISSMGVQRVPKALGTTLLQNIIKNKEMEKSVFLKERYFKGFNQFDTSMLENTKKFAAWMVNVLDEAGTKFMWNGEYQKAIDLGVSNPVLYADKATRKLVAGRGIGEKPLVQNSKIFQVIAPFQLEVGNLWWVMEDILRGDKNWKGKANAFITLFVSMYLFNNASEKTIGRRVGLDPIKALQDAYGEVIKNPNAKGAYKAGGRLAGEVLSNVPFGQTLAAAYPQYGGDIGGGIKLPTRRELFGQEDPTRFGTGPLVLKALADPFYKVLPPFGGSQVKKTVEGYQAIKEGKVKDAGGRSLYDVGGSMLKNLQTLAFGKTSGAAASDYYNTGITYDEAVLKRIKNSPNVKAELARVIKNDPAMADKLVAVIKKQALGITEDDQKLLNLGVANKARAKAVADQLNKLKTKEEKKALMLEYMKKKIITVDVAKQLPAFLKK